MLVVRNPIPGGPAGECQRGMSVNIRRGGSLETGL